MWQSVFDVRRLMRTTFPSMPMKKQSACHRQETLSLTVSYKSNRDVKRPLMDASVNFFDKLFGGLIRRCPARVCVVPVAGEDSFLKSICYATRSGSLRGRNQGPRLSSFSTEPPVSLPGLLPAPHGPGPHRDCAESPLSVFMVRLWRCPVPVTLEPCNPG